jgi:HAD superfamily hydrolase (TIGR01509 family)
VLLLDVMDTLVRDPFFEDVPALFGLSLEELFAQKHPTLWLDFERGEVSEEELLRGYFADGREWDFQSLPRTLEEGYAWLPGAQEALRRLRAAPGLRLHALSNYPVWYRNIEAKLRLSEHLEWSFVSCETGTRKPDAAAFEGAAAALGVPPGACVLVDDSASNCAAAEALGLGAVRFQGDWGAALAELESLVGFPLTAP